MEFLSAFGVNWKILVFQLINFGIIYFAFAKFVWPTILNALDKRQKTITTGLKNAEKAKQNLVTAETQKNAILDQAKKDARQLIEETRQQNQTVQNNFKIKMAAEKKELMALAYTQAEQEKNQILSTAQKEINQAIVDSISQFVTTQLSPSQKEQLTDNFVGLLKKA